jgi:hypothetical protein
MLDDTVAAAAENIRRAIILALDAIKRYVEEKL